MANFCGGIRFNGTTLHVVNGVITVVEEATVNVANAITVCGQLFDGAVFQIGTQGGKHVLTSIGATSEYETLPPIKSNCGIYLDPRYFTVTNGVVNFTERDILQVAVAQEGATITVTESGNTVQPFTGTTLYPMDVIGGTYVIIVELTGYQNFNTSVTADGNKIVNVNLTPTT